VISIILVGRKFLHSASSCSVIERLPSNTHSEKLIKQVIILLVLVTDFLLGGTLSRCPILLLGVFFCMILWGSLNLAAL
ncbi:hypothetical protein LINGRAHAP2_LOCUS6322, partial [Linum grandiflorum]